jgi:hypothetical protein
MDVRSIYDDLGCTFTYKEFCSIVGHYPEPIDMSRIIWNDTSSYIKVPSEDEWKEIYKKFMYNSTLFQ